MEVADLISEVIFNFFLILFLTKGLLRNRLFDYEGELEWFHVNSAASFTML